MSVTHFGLGSAGTKDRSAECTMLVLANPWFCCRASRLMPVPSMPRPWHGLVSPVMILRKIRCCMSYITTPKVAMVRHMMTSHSSSTAWTLSGYCTYKLLLYCVVVWCTSWVIAHTIMYDDTVQYKSQLHVSRQPWHSSIFRSVSVVSILFTCA